MKTTNQFINLSLKGFLEISDAYILPTNSGNLGDVMVSDGSGGVTWEPVSALSLTTNDITETAPNLFYTDERVDDRISLLIQDGTGLTWTYDDPSNTFTGNVSLAPFSTDDLSEGTTNLYYEDEKVDDRVSTLIQNNTGISWIYDDLANTLTPTINLGDFTTDDLPEGSSHLYFSNEAIDDRVAVLIQNGTGLTWTYDDPSNTLTGNVSLAPFTTDNLSEGLNNVYFTNERVDDRVADLIVDSATVTWAYNDSLGTLTATAVGSSIDISKDGSNIGSTTEINFIEGNGILLQILDDPSNNRINVTVENSSVGGGGTLTSVFDSVGQVGDSDIESLGFSSKFTVTESPDKFINIDISMLLDELSDVVVSSPASDNDALLYNSSLGIWENSSLSELIQLDELRDVTITTAQDGDGLIYNSTLGEWQNVPFPLSQNLSDLGDVSAASPISEGSILMYNSSLGIWEGVDGVISSLQDVSSLTPQDLQVLTYNTLSGLWEPFNVINKIEDDGATVLDHATTLNFENGLTAAVNFAFPGKVDVSLDASAISIFDLQDVTGVSPISDGDSLIYDAGSGTWITGTPSSLVTIIQEDGGTLNVGMPTLNFNGSDFLLSEAPADTFAISIKDSGIVHNATTGFVADEHIDHSTVFIQPGTGLSGGGDITASRTLNLDITGLTALSDSAIDDADQFAIFNQSAGVHEKATALNIKEYFGDLGSTIRHYVDQDLTVEDGDMYLIWGDLEFASGINVQNDGRIVVVNGSWTNGGSYTQGATGSFEIVSTNLAYILSEGQLTYGQHMFWTDGAGSWTAGDSTTAINAQTDNAYVTKEWVTNEISSIPSGTGVDNEVAVWSGTNSLDSSSNFTFDGTTLTVPNLTVNGTTTTVNSTVVTIADPIFQIGENTINDSKDRGISFLWNDGSAKEGFFGLDESSGRFSFIPDATNTSEVFSGSFGDAEFAKAYLSEIQISTGATDGYFLKADASGNGAWSQITASDISGLTNGLWTETTGGNIYRNTDVGIGDFSASEPSEALEVQGKIEVSGADAEFIGDLRGAIRFNAQAGEALSKGDVVYISGISGNTPIVMKADASDSAKMPAFGLAFDSAALNTSVEVVTFGTLDGLDTSTPGWSLGDTLYVSTTAGGLTNSAPAGESSLIQNIGKVQRVDAAAGSIKVGGAGRSNATPNLNRGSLFVGNSANQSSTLAIGAVDTFLRSDGTDASWSTINEYGGLTIGDSITGGTGNTTLREDNNNKLATGTLLDNGSTLAIGAFEPSSSLNIEDTLGNGIRVINTKANGLAKGALFSSQGANTGGNNIGISVSAYNSTGENIAGLFTATAGSGSAYALQLSDGTEGTGKFLKSVTSDGKANWATITTSDISGAVSATGGVDNRVAVFNAANTIEGDANFTWDGSKLSVNKPVNISNSGSELINLNKTGEKIVYFRDAAGTTIDASMGTKTVATSADTFFINKGTTVALEIDNGHNIDIPNGNLDVNGTITSTSASDAKLKLYTASGANNNRIEYLTSAGATRSYIGYAGASSFLYYHDTDNVEIRGGDMLLNSTGIVTIESGGSNAIVANTSQNVSIPNGTLTVNDSITTNHESVPSGIPALGTTASLFSILRTSTGTPLFGLLSNIDGLTGNTWLQAQRVDTATALDLLLNPKGGNVGIGLGSVDPTTELHVKGSGEILRLDTSSTTGNNFMAFYKGTTQMGYLGYSSSANNNMTLLNDTASGELQFWTTDASNATTKAMGIDSNGNVDISDGTLNIVAAADQLLTLEADSANYIRYKDKAGTTNRAYVGFSSAGNFNIYNQQNSKLGLYTNNTLGLEVQTNGNVKFDKSITINGGSPAANKYLKSTNVAGDAVWSTISTSEITGISGSANQVAYFTGTDLISGDGDFLFDGTHVSIGEAIDTGTQFNVYSTTKQHALKVQTIDSGGSVYAIHSTSTASNTGDNHGLYIDTQNPGTGRAYGIYENGSGAINLFNSNVVIGKDVNTVDRNYALYVAADAADNNVAVGTYTGGYDEYNINRSTGGSTDYEPSTIIASRNITNLGTGDFSFISMITGETGGGNNAVGIIGVQASLDGLSDHETDMIFGVRGDGSSTSSVSTSNRAHIQEGIRIIHGVSGQYTGGTDSKIDPTTVTPPRVRFGGSLGYTFPAKDGTNGDVLTTNGNGTVSWGSGGTGSGGGLTPTYQTGTTYTASAGDLVVAANAALVITLPTATAGAVVGVKATIFPIGMQVRSAAAAQTIDGQDRSVTGESINNQWDYIEFVAYTPDGGTSYDWLIR